MTVYQSPMLATALRLAGYGCILLLAVLSLLPAQDMVRTAAPGIVEHFVAYCGTAMLLAIGHGRASRTRIVLGLAVLAALMEMLQHFSPGRRPHLADFAASAAGGLFGVLLVGVLLMGVALASMARRLRP